jgi:hypothetical protein
MRVDNFEEPGSYFACLSDRSVCLARFHIIRQHIKDYMTLRYRARGRVGGFSIIAVRPSASRLILPK